MQVFTNNPLQGDVWDMQGAIINFGSSTAGGTASTGPTSNLGNAPIIATGLSLSYGRGVTKRYPINVRRVIYMLGNPDGQVQINCLFGPNQSMQNFLQTFTQLGANQGSLNYLNGASNSSSATSITITPFGQITYAGSGGSTGNLGLGMWKITDPVITGIGLNISESGGAGSTAAIATVTMSFNNLDIS